MSTMQSVSDDEMLVRYNRAQHLYQGMFNKNISRNSTLFPIWIGNSDSFWYEREFRCGREYRLVNANSASNECAFNHQSLAKALAQISSQEVDDKDLPIDKVRISLNPLTIEFTAFSKRWVFDTAAEICNEVPSHPSDWVISPDGKLAAFARNYNIWVHNFESGKEQALTNDGEEFYIYGGSGGAWGHDTYPGLQVVWSPDSRRIFTVQRDHRQVKILPVVHHVPQEGGLRPTVEYRKIAFPGDDHVEEFRLLVINVETGRVQDANYRRIPHFRNGWGLRGGHLGWWAKDNRRAYFIDMERGEHTVRVVEFDTHTGATSVLFEETTDTQINLSANSEDHPPFFVIAETNELVWWSERTGWAHLYLYDLNTGTLKNSITSGDWQVRDVIHFDAVRREAFVTTAGRTEGKNPYYRDLVRIHIDTGEINTLVSSDHEYVVTSPKVEVVGWAGPFFGRDVWNTNSVSPTENYAAVTRSRADQEQSR